jgi:hypothetical protein
VCSSDLTGLTPRAISGDCMALLHCAYRLTLAKDLYASVLLDWGDTWERKDFSASKAVGQDFLHNSPLGLGVGFSYATVVGPMSISWGRLIHGSVDRHYGPLEQPGIDNVIYFSAGHDF